MVSLLRRVLIVLVAFAIASGTTPQLARSAERGMVTVGMPCDMVVPMQAMDGQTKPMAPCKKMTADCIKQMGCVVDLALPARLVVYGNVAKYIPVNYWLAWSSLAGVEREPEPLPPRTI